MIFEENSGLGVVVPHNVIQETIEAAVKELTAVGQTIANPAEGSQ